VLRPAYLALTNTFALIRLLPMSDRDKDAEILALRHQLAVLQRKVGKPAFTLNDRTLLAALLRHLPCTGRKLCYYRWPGLSCRLPVFVDQTCKPGPALDPGGRDGEGDDVRGVVRRAQAHAMALVAAAGVVVADVLGQDHAQVLFASDEHPVGALGPYRAREALGIGVHPGSLGCDRQCPDSD
jgi:hypothetical protein